MPALEVRFGGRSTAGPKPVNEDAFAAFQPSPHLCRTKGAVAVVADGVSASSDAQQASQTAVTQFVDDFLATPETWTVKSSAARVMHGLNNWFYRHSRDDASMLTTFTAVVVRSTTAHIFHVGDCRVTRWRDGTLEPLTRDHRAGRDAYLTRALGMETRLEVDYTVDEIRAGDRYVITTDGVHDFLRPDQLTGLLQPGGDLEVAASAIVDAAVIAGTNDNATCLIVGIDQVGEESLDEAHRRITRQVIPPALSVDTMLDGFRVLRVLHNGTRSHLYLVDGADHDKPLVMKVPSENLREDADYLERFLREEWIGQQLDHPAIVQFVERPRETPFLYVLMEHIPGITLRQWIHDNPQPSLSEVRRIIAEVAGGLRAMQRKQMVHQDLKPENIMVDDNGRAYIIDLGTVHVSGLEDTSRLLSTIPVGSVGYVAPECLRGEAPTLLGDIYSLGVICYEQLAGVLPYKTPVNARNPKSYKHQDYQPLRHIREDVPDWLDMTIAKAVAWDPAKRYQALSEFLTDLSEPNAVMVRRITAAPLLERNPLLFWKLLSGVLAALLVVALLH